MRVLPDGYVLRVPAPEEAGAVADLLNAVEVAISGISDTSEERIRWQWNSPGVNVERDLRIVESPVHGILGYAELETFEPWTQLGVDGYVHPDHTGLGIGATLADWAERRAAEEARKAAPGEKVVLRHSLWVEDTDSRAFLESRGWKTCRWFYWMLIDLHDDMPEPAPVPGIEFRSMRPGEERAAWAADNDAFHDHWGFVPEPFEEWLHHHLRREDSDPGLLLLAMDGDNIAGCAMNFPKREEDAEKGWVQFLGVRPPWRRRGIALALLQHSFRALRERGCKRVGLGVDAENPNGAVALYEKAGMRKDREAVSYETVIREPAT